MERSPLEPRELGFGAHQNSLESTKNDTTSFVAPETVESEPETEITEIKVFETEHLVLGKVTKKLVTRELNGCTATLILLNRDKGREVIFCHYPNFAFQRQLNEVDNILRSSESGIEVEGIFMYANKKRISSTTDLQRGLIDLLKTSVPVQIEAYDNALETLEVDVSAEGGPANYKGTSNSGSIDIQR